jgi:hypothetical protein
MSQNNSDLLTIIDNLDSDAVLRAMKRAQETDKHSPKDLKKFKQLLSEPFHPSSKDHKKFKLLLSEPFRPSQKEVRDTSFLTISSLNF